MTRLFSYVVEHDLGIAPNPFGGYCTLAKCKYSKSNRRNLVELARKGDWIIGTGGADRRKSAGHGRLIYAMHVDEIMSLAAYYVDSRFRRRRDNDSPNELERFVLISQRYFYFGRNAIDISDIPNVDLAHPLEKKGPGFRKDFHRQFIDGLIDWLHLHYQVGVHGSPCGYEDGGLIQLQA